MWYYCIVNLVHRKEKNMTFGIIGAKDLPEFDTKVVKVDAWYDRHTRDYCIQLKNKDGYQVGDSIRVGTKADKEAEVNYQMIKHHLI